MEVLEIRGKQSWMDVYEEWLKEGEEQLDSEEYKLLRKMQHGMSSLMGCCTEKASQYRYYDALGSYNKIGSWRRCRRVFVRVTLTDNHWH